MTAPPRMQKLNMQTGAGSSRRQGLPFCWWSLPSGEDLLQFAVQWPWLSPWREAMKRHPEPGSDGALGS